MPPALLQREAAMPPALLEREAAMLPAPAARAAPRAAAFLLTTDGGMRRLEVPLDAHGRPFKLESVGWRFFVQDALNLEFTVEGSELPRPPFEEWAAEDSFRLPAQN
jgi:hypothetical protein